jgi:type II secretory pathway pseudopilin PulG
MRRDATHSGEEAFSLLEVLIVVVVVALLLGLILPALKSAQQSGLENDDIARLRQLGMARSMYASEYETEIYRCPPLVAAGLAPAGLCHSKSDYVPGGLANLVLSALAKHSSFYAPAVTPYPMSYIAAGDLLFPKDIARVETQQAAGWLVNLIRTEIDLDDPANAIFAPGQYQRLLLDGAVINRSRTRYAVQVDGHTETVSTPYFLYCDPDQEWINEITTK